MKRSANSAIVFAAIWLISFSARAGDWPHWRGPNHDGVAEAENLPVSWSAEENIAWKVKLPAWSGSTPIIHGDRVFVISPGEAAAAEQPRVTQGRRSLMRNAGARNNPGGDAIFLYCLDRKDGQELWKRELDTGNKLGRKGNSSSNSPATDGKYVYTMTGNGALAAHDYDGEQIWKINIQDKYGDFGLQFNHSSTPLLLEDRLIIPVLHGYYTDEPSYMLAIDKTNGETLWHTIRPTDAEFESPDSYASPILLDAGGRQQVIINGGDIVTAHDAESGKEIWRCGGLNPEGSTNYRIISSCVVAGGLIIAPTRVRPMLAIRPGGSGDITETHIAWSFDNGPDVPIPVSDGELLWILKDKGGIFHCLDLKTGEELREPQRLAEGTYSASPVLAGGYIYCTNEEGVTTVLEATKEFKILATNRLDDSYTLSSIAVAGEQLFLRTGDYLYCIGK